MPDKAVSGKRAEQGFHGRAFRPVADDIQRPVHLLRQEGKRFGKRAVAVELVPRPHHGDGDKPCRRRARLVFEKGAGVDKGLQDRLVDCGGGAQKPLAIARGEADIDGGGIQCGQQFVLNRLPAHAVALRGIGGLGGDVGNIETPAQFRPEQIRGLVIGVITKPEVRCALLSPALCNGLDFAFGRIGEQGPRRIIRLFQKAAQLGGDGNLMAAHGHRRHQQAGHQPVAGGNRMVGRFERRIKGDLHADGCALAAAAASTGI